MRLVSLPATEAEGAILAHSQRTEGGVIRKGRVLSAADVVALSGAGSLTVAILDEGDVGEDEAAHRVAQAAAGVGVRIERADTGRVNLFADGAGLITVDEVGVHRLNGVDSAVTLATLAPFQRVAAGQMVGTVKIIPFALPAATVERARQVLAGPVLQLAPWHRVRIATISTELPVLKAGVIDKTLAVLSRRLADTGAAIASDTRVHHNTQALAGALGAADGDLCIVFGASAVMDEDDVIPAAIREAGGVVRHVGMPVDPGNLLVLGEIDGRSVIGAPGCARSPKRNGFDWVLDRLLAGLEVSGADIERMGVGGLLTDTPARPRPRRGTVAGATAPAALVLAAGRSARMGATNKLTEEVGGVAMVRRVVEAALASRATPVVVVTGHDVDRVCATLAGLPVSFAYNPAYADGLSTSLQVGLRALPESADAALVLLGDMPLVTGRSCDAILAALSDPDILVSMATAAGKRGNPVAWSKTLFPELLATEGDAGGRALLSRYRDQLAEVEIGDAAALDADTPAALEAIRAVADDRARS